MTAALASKRWVTTAVIVSGVLAAVDDVSHGRRPNVRIALGAFVAGALLLLLAEVAPQLAGGLAALLLVSAILNTGGKAFPALTKGLSA